MDLKVLEGNIIGVVSKKINALDYGNKSVEEIILKKCDDALKMVGLDTSFKTQQFNELSKKNQNKVILASKLHDDAIILYGFMKGMLKKEIQFYKNLFKKISLYNKKIILVENNVESFFNLVDNIYVINNNIIEYQTNDLYDQKLYDYCDMPKMVEFIYLTKKKGIKIDNYTDFNDLLKAVFRLKS